MGLMVHKKLSAFWHGRVSPLKGLNLPPLLSSTQADILRAVQHSPTSGLQEEEDADEGGVDASGKVMTGMKDDEGEGEEEEGLHPQDIDAYWLQRRLAKAYEETGNPIDADKSQQLANDVFSILQACFAASLSGSSSHSGGITASRSISVCVSCFPARMHRP